MGLSQAQLAERAGLSQGEVSRLEGREDFDNVRVGTLRRYIEGLCLDMQILGTPEAGDSRRFVLAGSRS